MTPSMAGKMEENPHHIEDPLTTGKSETNSVQLTECRQKTETIPKLRRLSGELLEKKNASSSPIRLPVATVMGNPTSHGDLSTPEGQQELGNQVEEIINLCKGFSLNIKHISHNQSKVEEWISTQANKDAMFKADLEKGITKILTETEVQRDSMIRSAINQVMGNVNVLAQEVKQSQDLAGTIGKQVGEIQQREQMRQNEQMTRPIIQPTWPPQREENEGNRSGRLNDALRLLTKEYLYKGDPNLWLTHKAKLRNLIWVNNLTKEEAIKVIKMSFSDNSIHMIENIDVQPFLAEMNGSAVEQYLAALEGLFISQSGQEMSRVKFNISKQDVGESLTMWATRLKCLHRIAFPDELAIDSNLNVKDRFITGMNDVNQKKYVLEQRRPEDDLNKLLQLGLKHEAVKLMIQPQVETTGYNMLKENKPEQTEQVNMIKQSDRRRNSRQQYTEDQQDNHGETTKGSKKEFGYNGQRKESRKIPYCIFCEIWHHNSRYCGATYTMEFKKSQVRKHFACMACFKSGHTSNNCFSNVGLCPICPLPDRHNLNLHTHEEVKEHFNKFKDVEELEMEQN